MSAHIVYQGNVRGHGGALFKDMKFWIAHRVPMRSTWIQDIENNGGTVVQLDKLADFLIADHAKKDVPAGSYSWKWIEESVKGGRLLEREKYQISAPGNESRPVGSVPQKVTRNPFAKQDDLLLAQFVTKYERQGYAVSGNVIYKQLEDKYPHHTFQSWRDRWVKKLQFLPRPQASDNSPSPTPATAGSAISARPQAAPNLPAQAPASSHNPGSDSPLKKTRARFTREEDETLLQYVEEMRSYSKGIAGKKIYQDFAEDFPQHTWQAWRDRYLKQLRPRENLAEAEVTPQSSPIRSNAQPRSPQKAPWPYAAAAAAGQSPTCLKSSPPDVDSRPAASRSTFNTLQPEVANPEPVVGPSDESQRREELNDVEELQEDFAAEDAEVDAVPLHKESEESEVDQEHSRRRSASLELGEGATASSPAIIQSQYPLIAKKEDFYEFLTDFRELDTQLQQEQVKIWPTIQGRTFELWDLWTAVQRQKAEPAERDWQQIAEEIGYDWIRLPDAPDQIMRFYESHLSDFEELMLSYGSPDSDDGVGVDIDEAEDEDEEAQTPQPPLPRFPVPSNVRSDGHFNSSPPRQPSLKRSHDAALPDLAYPGASRKRSRLGRDSEIPSTPDEKNGTLHLRPPVSAGVSPNDRRHHALPKSSQFLQNSRKGKQVEANDVQEDEDMDDGVPESPTRTIPRRVAAEPETQDFRFETQVMDEIHDEDTQPEITPSQQLQSDIDAERRRQELNNDSPMPKRKFVKSPFLADEDDQEDEVVVPKPRYGKRANPLLSQSGMQGSKRRSLPASFARRMGTPVPTRKSLSGEIGASTPVPNSAQRRETPSQAQPTPRIRSKGEELAEVVDYWMSLGYSYDHARRSLEATTWEPGLAGRIMQMLREGQSIPNNWEGVWTARDDEQLQLINSAAPPRDEKEARKRRKAADRLIDKHGEERMQLRKKWLVAKAEL